MILGLGPGDPEFLSAAAHRAIGSALLLLCPVPEHPALASSDPARRRSPAAAAAGWPALTEDLPADALVVVALPGHPAEHAPVVIAGAPPAQILPAPGIIDTLCAGFGLLGREAGLQVLTAPALLAAPPGLAEQGYAAADAPWCEQQDVARYTTPRSPLRLTALLPALVVLRSYALAAPLDDDVLAAIQPTLLERYSADVLIRALSLDGLGAPEWQWQGRLADLHMSELRRAQALYLPALNPLADQRSSEGLIYVAARLLGPYGCPWDRRQSHQSLRAGLLEEVYEVLEALDAGNDAALAEELGDLLLQVIVHSEMARQAGRFDYGDVLAQITAKLIRRHPHVFGDLAVSGNEEVLANWEQIKAGERAAKGQERQSALDGVPAALPALAAMQKLFGRAARTGFEWPGNAQAWAKVEEELAELRAADQADDAEQRAAEFGDLLLALSNWARRVGIDAEAALREAGARFRRRFEWMEQALAADGRSLADCDLAEMLELWQAAKAATGR
jgi:tetrapyrrole methylase family protein/MazG family protein